MLITVEGIDGSGKNTLACGLSTVLAASHDVKMVASPGYDRTETGKLIGRYLSGNFDLGNDSPYALSLLFALDRQEGQPDLRKWLAEGKLVIADRYAASNIAYQAARADDPDESARVRQFVLDLEYQRLSTIVPAYNIWLDIPVDFSRELIARKGKRDYVSTTYDKFEADGNLMRKVSEEYRELAKDDRYGKWIRIEPVQEGALRAAEAILDEALGRLDLYS
ncbi:hypothetical protein [Martelella radicis]|uniref:Thymidylate kinase n=1 Tax=Martelella radicis TaxID=1397476 RepID=A0A7W6KR67_9HYPH|nr:hypothetical protein [Martelella radicis]MBB4124463.1 dTMP kinase [Martelella radicis]